MVKGEYKPNYLRFSAWFLGLSIGISIGFALVESLFDLEIATVGTSIVPVMMASTYEGVHFARQENVKPHGARAWRIALQLTLVSMLLSIILAGLFVVLAPELFEAALSVLGGSAVIGIVLCITILSILVVRLFFGMGARNELKVIARKSQREST